MKFLAEEDRLIITLNWAETFFALKHRLVIPRSAIINLDWQPQYSFARQIWRTGGADIPGVLWAGHFRRRGQRAFLYLLRPQGMTWVGGSVQTQNVLVIEAENYRFDQILLTCEPDIGAGLINWWRGTSSPKQPSA